MKILRIYPTLPPYPGGVEQHVVRLSEAQRRDGIEVVIVYAFGAATHPSDVRIASIFAINRIRPQFIRDFAFYLLAAIHLLWHRKHFDVVHVHGDWSAFICGRFLSLVVGARTRVASVHDRLRTGRWWDSLYASVLRGYDFCYSTGQMDAKRLSHLMKRRIAWITSGLHPTFQDTAPVMEPNVDPRSIDVLTVATLTARKRIDLVLQIANLLPNVRFRIVGDGPERPRLESTIRQARLENVTLTGRLSVDEVRREYLRSKIFLLTSSSEGTPTAVLEAMACGLPVVISASNDFSDLLEDGQTGYVVRSSTPKEYADKISDVLHHETIRVHMGKTNHEKAIAFSWTNVASSISRAMETALRQESDSLSPIAPSR